MTTAAAVVRYEPRGAAREFMTCKAPEVVLAGPAGSGKSLAMLFKLHLACLMVPRMRALLVRQTHLSLTGTTLVTFERDVAGEMLAAGGVRWFGGSARRPAAYEYGNGSVLTVGGLDKPEKFMGGDYDRIAVDEVTQVSERAWETLISRLRGTAVRKVDGGSVRVYKQIVGACNPDHPFHWLKLRSERGSTVMLSSLHRDNPAYFNLDGTATVAGRDYMSKLDALTGVRKQRLKAGLWVAAEGTVYEFSDALHFLDPFEIPAEWPRFLSVDFGFCVDEETEILTMRGWLSLDQVKAGDRCLSLSPNTGMAEWDDVGEVSIFPAGPRQMIAMQSLSHSSLTTPNHRWLCRYHRSDETRLRFTTTDSFTTEDMVPTARPVTNLPQVAKYTDAFVELVAWYWTEGSRWRAGNGNTRGVNTGGFVSQNKGLHADRIRAVLVEMFGPPSVTMREGKRRTREPKWRDWTPRSNSPASEQKGQFHLNGPALAPVLAVVEGYEKVVSADFITSLTRSQLGLFISISIAGDGYVASEKSGTTGITQKSRRRLDAFQMACQLAGIATVMRHHVSGKYDWYSLTLFSRYRDFKPRRLRLPEVYAGRIWCPTTSNGTWLARRRGTVYFTGNTNAFVAQWWAADPDSRLYRFREHYRTQRLVEDHAADILATCTRPDPDYVHPPRQPRYAYHGRVWTEPRPRAVVCDHDAEDRATLERHLGMSTQGARKSVKVGIEAVQSRLKVAGDGRARLFLVRGALVERDPRLEDAKKPTCTEEEVGGYVWAPGPDGKPAKEEPLKVDDHGCDCVRYACAHVDLGGQPRMRWM